MDVEAPFARKHAYTRTHTHHLRKRTETHTRNRSHTPKYACTNTHAHSVHVSDCSEQVDRTNTLSTTQTFPFLSFPLFAPLSHPFARSPTLLLSLSIFALSRSLELYHLSLPLSLPLSLFSLSLFPSLSLSCYRWFGSFPFSLFWPVFPFCSLLWRELLVPSPPVVRGCGGSCPQCGVVVVVVLAYGHIKRHL